MAEEMREAAGEDEQDIANEMAEAFLNENLPDKIFGAPKAGPGMWASCLRVMNPVMQQPQDEDSEINNTLQKVSLDQVQF